MYILLVDALNVFGGFYGEQYFMIVGKLREIGTLMHEYKIRLC